MYPRRRHDAAVNSAGSLALAIIGVAAIVPLLWIGSTLISSPRAWGEFRPTSFRLHLLARTLGYNGAVALLATAMGLPAGWVLGRGRGWLVQLLWILIPTALFMPSLAYAYGWSQCVRLMQPLIGTLYPAGPGDVIRCVVSLATWLWGVPAIVIGTSLRRLDPAVQMQALLDGALFRVTLKQLSGPILASVAIVLILATQEFSVYEPTGISVIATEVRMVFDTGAVSSASNAMTSTGLAGAGREAPDQSARAAAAIATAAPLILITLLLAIFVSRTLPDPDAAGAISPSAWPAVLDATGPLKGITGLLVLINVGIPIGCLVGSLHTRFDLANALAVHGPQLAGSIWVGAEAAGVALVLAAFCAAGWMRGSLLIAATTFLVGGQILAIALIRMFNRPGLSWAYDSSVLPVIAYVGRFGWLAVAAGRATWAGPWRDLRAMGELDGASPMKIARSIVWPLAWPTLLAGGLLVGALSLCEVPATVLLLPQNPQVLTPTLMTWVHMTRYDPMIEASLLMVTTVIVPAIAAMLLVALGKRYMQSISRTT